MPKRKFPAFCFINAKGIKYYVRRTTSKRGKVMYKATTVNRDALYHLPNGYQIIESPNGVVSIVKERLRAITIDEELCVKELIKKINADTLTLRVWGDELTIYERQFNARMLHQIAKALDPLKGEDFERKFVLPDFDSQCPSEAHRRFIDIGNLRDYLGFVVTAKSANRLQSYIPVVRLRLADKTQRLFSTDIFVLGNQVDWWRLGSFSFADIIADIIPAILTRQTPSLKLETKAV